MKATHYLANLQRPMKQRILLLLDIALVTIAMVFAQALAIGTWPFNIALSPMLPAIFALSASCAVLSLALELPKVQLKSYEWSALTRTASMSAILSVVYALLLYLDLSQAEPGTPVIFGFVYVSLNAATRLILLQILLWIYRSLAPTTSVLIYGAGKTGGQLAMALRSSHDFRLIGFIDDNELLHGISVAGLKVFPSRETEQLIKTHHVERVLLAMPSLNQVRQAQIAQRVARLNVEVQALPSFSQLIGSETLTDRLTTVLPNQMLGRDSHRDALDGGGEAYEGRVVLISGAGGSIGSELCRQILLCKPAKLVLLEQTEFTLFSIERELRALTENAPCTIVPVLGSVTDEALVAALLDVHGVQVVLHAAAYKHVPMVEKNPVAGIRNNVFGTQIIAQAALNAGIERFVLISTDKAVRPIGIMGATKRLAETVVGDLARKSEKTIFCITRFGNVLGSSGSVVPIFHEQISRGGPITLTDPHVTRYFMTIQEACRLVLWAGTLAKGGEIFVLDMGKPIRIAELARQVIEASGFTVRDEENPDGDIEIVTTGLREGEKLHEELAFNAALVPSSHPKLSCATDKFLTEFEVTRALQKLNALAHADGPGRAVEEVMHWIERDLAINTSRSDRELEM